MADNLNAEIIAIGTEILLGEITDTNSVFMARALRDIGVNIYYMTTVGDNLGRISDAIDLALDRAEVVITCGGLGPTVDDMTRQGVANATNRELVFQQKLYDIIAERFRGFGVTMTENNKQQAYLPQDAILIENPVGTAPSFVVETDRGVVISLPGVPREMKYLMTSSVVPYLLDKYKLGVIIARVLKTAGIGESSLDDKIGKDLLSAHNPTVGLAAHHGSVDVRITAKADSREDAEKLLDGMQEQLLLRIGDDVYGTDNDTIEDIVISKLQLMGYHLNIVEAGLPGIISDKLTTFSNYQVELASHPNEIFEKYDIDKDSDLKDCAIWLAETRCEPEAHCCSIVILSNPNVEENEDIKQGSAIAVSLMGNTRYRVYGFGAKSDLARDWMPRWGLSSLWRLLKEQDNDMG